VVERFKVSDCAHLFWLRRAEKEALREEVAWRNTVLELLTNEVRGIRGVVSRGLVVDDGAKSRPSGRVRLCCGSVFDGFPPFHQVDEARINEAQLAEELHRAASEKVRSHMYGISRQCIAAIFIFFACAKYYV
jgi:hypothetical protein